MSNEMSAQDKVISFRLEISGGFLLLLSLTAFLCGAEALAAAVLAASFHELGHLLLILEQGSLPKRLTLDISGACLRCSGPIPKRRQELVRALAGPTAGLLLWLILLPSETALLRLTAGMSLMLSLVNLLPAEELDGGRILECLIASTLNEAWWARISALANGFSVLLTLTLGILHSPQLFFYGLWLLLRRLMHRLRN